MFDFIALVCYLFSIYAVPRLGRAFDLQRIKFAQPPLLCMTWGEFVTFGPCLLCGDTLTNQALAHMLFNTLNLDLMRKKTTCTTFSLLKLGVLR